MLVAEALTNLGLHVYRPDIAPVSVRWNIRQSRIFGKLPRWYQGNSKSRFSSIRLGWTRQSLTTTQTPRGLKCTTVVIERHLDALPACWKSHIVSTRTSIGFILFSRDLIEANREGTRP
jgi:hypothetical protein